jgi:predicted nuclease of predicted toxin-antitoxin system
VKVLIDAQLPPALVETFAINGVEAVHVTAVGLVAAADREIWDYALESRYSIATKDEDFFLRSVVSNSPTPFIIWVRRGNCSNRELQKLIADALDQIRLAHDSGERLIEIR